MTTCNKCLIKWIPTKHGKDADGKVVFEDHVVKFCPEHAKMIEEYPIVIKERDDSRLKSAQRQVKIALLKYELAASQTEVKRLKEWVNDLQSGVSINCAYCGHNYGPADEVPATMAEFVKEHIEQCPKHPMAAMKKELESCEEELAEAEVVATNARKESAVAKRSAISFITSAWCDEHEKEAATMGYSDFAEQEHGRGCVRCLDVKCATLQSKLAAVKDEFTHLNDVRAFYKTTVAASGAEINGSFKSIAAELVDVGATEENQSVGGGS